LEQCARVFRRPFLPEPRYRLRQRGADLNPESARHLDELDAAGVVLAAQRCDGRMHRLGVEAVALVEQAHELIDRHRPAGGRPRGLDHIAYVLVVHWAPAGSSLAAWSSGSPATASFAAPSSLTSFRCRPGLPSRTCKGP